MPLYKYLKATVTKNGKNEMKPLKLSEAYLLSRMAQDNDKIIVRAAYCSKQQYKSIFG